MTISGNTYTEPTGMKPSVGGGRKVKKDWEEGIVKKPGTFTRYAKANHESMAEAITKGEKSKNPLTRKRANLAKVFRTTECGSSCNLKKGAAFRPKGFPLARRGGVWRLEPHVLMMKSL